MYGTHTGRIGLKIFNGCKHITLNNFFCDGVPAGNSEFGAFTAFDTGNTGTQADAKTYRFNFQHAGTGGDFIEQHQKGYTQRADSFTSRESEVTLTDNTVHSFKLGPQNETRGLIAIAATGGDTSGLVWVNVSSGGAASKLLASDGTGVLNVATGALTGTTGTDSKFTISAHTDGKVYIENRVGFATKFSYTILSAF